MAFQNPAVEWFTAQIHGELVMAQVLIQRQASGAYELRHIEDRSKPADSLRLVPPEEARGIAQFTEHGAFRPLKSTPNLRRDWRIVCRSDGELELALNRLYPGAIADLYAARAEKPPVTHYREFTNRQTGMYRITTFLSDEDAATAIRKCCAPANCLKRRLWSVGELPADDPSHKSIIPCLEPCAVMLEFARRVVRAIQKENAPAAKVVENLEPQPHPEQENE